MIQEGETGAKDNKNKKNVMEVKIEVVKLVNQKILAPENPAEIQINETIDQTDENDDKEDKSEEEPKEFTALGQNHMNFLVN